MSCVLFDVLIVGIVHSSLAFVQSYLGFFDGDLNHPNDEVCLCRHNGSVGMLFGVELNIEDAICLINHFVYSF
jgi:hypothetical protein